MPASPSGLPYAMHSTPVAGSGDTRDLPLVDGVHQQLQILERGRRQHSVAQVEDVAQTTARSAQNPAGALAHELGRAQQHSRIEIALYAAVVTDTLPADIEWHAPVERYNVRARRHDRLEQRGGVRPEMDARNIDWFQGFENRASVSENSSLVVLNRQGADPGVEKLYRARTSRDMRHQVSGHRRRELRQQLLERGRL